jgi:hypothetical protein
LLPEKLFAFFIFLPSLIAVSGRNRRDGMHGGCRNEHAPAFGRNADEYGRKRDERMGRPVNAGPGVACRQVQGRGSREIHTLRAAGAALQTCFIYLPKAK